MDTILKNLIIPANVRFRVTLAPRTFRTRFIKNLMEASARREVITAVNAWEYAR